MPLTVSGYGRGGGIPAAPDDASNLNAGERAAFSSNPRPWGLFPGMVLTGVTDRSGVSLVDGLANGSAAGTSTAASVGEATGAAIGAAAGTSTAAAEALIPGDGAAAGTSTAAAISQFQADGAAAGTSTAAAVALNTSTFALITSAVAQSSDNLSVTTAAIDTTGADLLVVLTTGVVGVPAVVSDSEGNTWVGLTARDNGANSQGRIFYSLNPNVGATHTFTNTAAAGGPSIIVAAYSGADLVAPFDQENGAANSSGTTIATGSITPSEGSELIVIGLTGAMTGANSVDVGTILHETTGPITTAYNIAMAHEIQSAIVARNATWTTSSNQKEAMIASFRSTV